MLLAEARFDRKMLWPGRRHSLMVAVFKAALAS